MCKLCWSAALKRLVAQKVVRDIPTRCPHTNQGLYNERTTICYDCRTVLSGIPLTVKDIEDVCDIYDCLCLAAEKSAGTPIPEESLE